MCGIVHSGRVGVSLKWALFQNAQMITANIQNLYEIYCWKEEKVQFFRVGVNLFSSVPAGHQTVKLRLYFNILSEP